MNPQEHASGGHPSPELSSELKNLKMVVEARRDRSPEGLQALGTIKSALEAAEAGRDAEARSIIADAWAWITENLSLSGIAENASGLGETISAGALELGEKISKGWSGLFGSDEPSDGKDEAIDDVVNARADNGERAAQNA